MEDGARHRYEYSVDLTSDTAPARVVRMVGQGKRVLEIGAGPGSITRLLHDVGNCHITALEVDVDAIHKLTPFCERVYRVDLNDASWPQTLSRESTFDVIVAADVLEHLYDPWLALKAMKGLIGQSGYIVVSLPHVGHSAVLACLLAGDFEYRDSGLLDRTHIRFFGIKNIQALFDSAGLKIVEGQFVVRSPASTEFAKQWKKIPPEVRGALSTNRFGTIYQVVVKAVPNESPGCGISLASLPIGAPSVDATSRVMPASVVEAIKRGARAFLSPETRSRLRRLVAYLGIRF